MTLLRFGNNVIRLSAPRASVRKRHRHPMPGSYRALDRLFGEWLLLQPVYRLGEAAACAREFSSEKICRHNQRRVTMLHLGF